MDDPEEPALHTKEYAPVLTAEDDAEAIDDAHEGNDGLLRHDPPPFQHQALLPAPVWLVLSFLALTFGSIALIFGAVRALDWEHDERLTLYELWLYQSKDIATDTLVFLLVGRMATIDWKLWIGTILAANFYASYVTQFRFLQHSLTLYEMHCTWPWTLWIFVLVLVVGGAGLVASHVRFWARNGLLVTQLGQVLVAVLLFVVPYAGSPYFHLHHWYAGWLLGMHANIDVWWSRITMAWCWGLYINGIAVYGRDPVLVCGYAMWLSDNLRCPYLECYLTGTSPSAPPSPTPPVVPMLPPDWRNCSASTYHGR